MNYNNNPDNCFTGCNILDNKISGKSPGYSIENLNCDILNEKNQSYNPNNLFVNNSNNIKYNDYKQSFTPNRPLIEQYIAQNNGELLHNNLPNGSLLGEGIVEYKINIDSSDRNIDVYPNPFNYTVTFGSLNGQTRESMEWIDSKNKSLGKKKVKYNGTPGPYISREFRNIKFMNIDHLILPKYSTVMLDPTDNIFKFEQSSLLTQYKYLILKIKEFVPTSQMYATNSILESGIMVFPHGNLNDFFYYGNAHFHKTFNLFQLGNLTKFSVEYYTDTGIPIKYRVLDSNGNEISPDTDMANRDKFNNIYNPLIQNFFTLSIGVIENYMNTMVKYDK